MASNILIPDQYGKFSSFADANGSQQALVDAHQSVQSVLYGPGGAALFPTAAALGDTTTNPTTALIGALLEGFNGTTWDRIKALGNAMMARPYGLRNGGVLHRSAITTYDKMTAVAGDAPPAFTSLVGQASGTLVAGTTYSYLHIAGNRWGSMGEIYTGRTTALGTGANAFRYVPGVHTGADYYDIFCGSNAAGNYLWVGRITAAQLAAGCEITALGTVVSPAVSNNAVNAVVVDLVGSFYDYGTPPFNKNNSYLPASVTPIVATGYSRAHAHVKMAVTNLYVTTSLTLIPFFQDQTSTNDWFMGTSRTFSFGLLAGQPFEQDWEIDVDGATNFVILVDAIAGNGATATVWVELV